MEDILNSLEIKTLNEKYSKISPLKMDSFDNEECIGVGAFGKVYKVKNKITNEYYAMKILNIN